MSAQLPPHQSCIEKMHISQVPREALRKSIELPPHQSLADKMLRALRYLTKEREAHPCGGFTIDDMAWQAGELFAEKSDTYEAADDLIKAGLIRFVGESGEEICYALREEGGAS